MKILHGSTRICFLIWKYAIKIPSLVEWRLFLLGLLANLQEVNFSTMKLPEYCPVLFHIPGGFLNIYPRCKPLSRKEFITLNYFELTDNVIMFNNLVENKQDSFGWLNNRIVAVDYGS